MYSIKTRTLAHSRVFGFISASPFPQDPGTKVFTPDGNLDPDAFAAAFCRAAGLPFPGTDTFIRHHIPARFSLDLREADSIRSLLEAGHVKDTPACTLPGGIDRAQADARLAMLMRDLAVAAADNCIRSMTR